MRLTKTVDGKLHTYLYEGGLLDQETRGDEIFDYSYDANGSIRMLKHRATESATPTYYYYALNSRNDVVGLYDANGAVYAKYTYDPWGNITSVTNASGTAITDTNNIAHTQPFRYRSYYYNTDSGMYYVFSRYYDPAVGRWINPEQNVFYGEFDKGARLNCHNVYIYCANNPIKMVDVLGMYTISLTIGANITILAGASVGIGLSFDDDGNIAIQWVHSIPNEETFSFGLVDAGIAVSGQYNSADTVYDLEGVSSNIGFSVGKAAYVGIDAVANSRVAVKKDDKIDGLQITGGYGIGMDIHVNQVKTQTIKTTTWKKLFNWFTGLFKK